MFKIFHFVGGEWVARKTVCGIVIRGHIYRGITGEYRGIVVLCAFFRQGQRIASLESRMQFGVRVVV